MQDNAQQGIIDVNLAVVIFKKTQFPKFVHEKIDSRPRGAHHLRQHLLRDLGEHLRRVVVRAVASEQQQRARQAFLAGIEELVDQVFFGSEISRQNEGDKAVGKLMFLVKDAEHFLFLEHEQGARLNGDSGRQSNGVARKARFTKEIAGSEYRQNCFLAGFIDDRKSDAAFLNVQNILGGIALRVDGFLAAKLDYGSS